MKIDQQTYGANHEVQHSIQTTGWFRFCQGPELKRILILGTSGAGKTTLAARLSAQLGLPHIASDPFYWERGWRPAPADAVRQRLSDATAGDQWVLDGNCVTDRDIVWARADTAVWLDYSRALVMRRVTVRNLRWAASGKAVWSGNRMTWGRAWSGVAHARKGYAQKSATYPGYFSEFPHLTVLRFSAPRETERWLKNVRSAENGQQQP